MIRFRLMLDKDKEIKWLDQMASDGFALKSFFAGFYSFVPCEKGEWQYQIDIGQGFFSVKPEYREFMEEMGVEIVQTWGPWVILRRHREEGAFELYSDVDSRIEHYKKILLLFKLVGLLELFCLIFCVYLAVKAPEGWPWVFMMAAIVCVFMNMIVRTKRILNSLYEQKGETPAGYNGRRVSAMVPVGMLINSVNLILQDKLPTAVRMVMMIIALILILYGVAVTAAGKTQ